jgi:hypothetical protein
MSNVVYLTPKSEETPEQILTSLSLHGMAGTLTMASPGYAPVIYDMITPLEQDCEIILRDYWDAVQNANSRHLQVLEELGRTMLERVADQIEKHAQR